MSTLRISDAPLLPDVDGSEKIPTGGRGDYTISVDQIKDHIFQDIGKELVGLGNVDNTSDLDKPVSTAQQAALNLKADKTYVDTNLDLKADKTSVYTRSETSLALSQKADLVNGVIPESQIPSSFNDVLEFTTPNLPIVGEIGKIYVTTDNNKTWRWGGNRYVEISGWNPDSVSKSVTLPTYYTKESGVDTVTGVADGAYFNVRSEDDDTIAVEYQNVGGSAVATGKICLSALGAQQQEKSASTIKDASGKDQQEINTELNTSANDYVNLKYNEITTSIKRSIGDVIYDLVLDVTWFGAKSDHNYRTGDGTVNDTAFQNCINFIGSLGSIRDGGKVKISIPSGAYQLQHLDINTYAAMGFGLEFVGGGANSTILYFDESYTTEEAITCNMQGVVFRNVALHGSLTTIAIPTGRTKAIHAQNLTSDADIDITFIDCNAVAWNDFAHIYGRGFVWRGGLIAHTSQFLVVQNEVYNNSTPTRPNNIMRHYRIQGARVDSVSLLMKVEGSNTSQQINNVNITMNDFYTLDRLINFEGHTINGLVETGNNQLHSFATSMIRGTHLKNSVVTGAAIIHRADASAIPTTDGECIGKVVDLLGDSVGNIISDNVIKNLRENIIHVRGAAIGNIISGNTLPECWSRSNTAADRILCRLDGAVRTGNIIKDNAATSSVFSGTFRQTNIPLANLGDNIVKDNTSPWTWADAVQTAFVSVYSGATDITSGIANDNRLCRFVFNGDYVEGVLHLSVNTVETGAISMALPVPSVTDLPTVTSTFGGDGLISNIIGFNAVGYIPAPIFVNAATDRFEFYKLKDMARTTLTWADGAATRTIYASFRYRYK